MVKQTFFNLSDSKRKELLRIARKEFSIRPIHEATISNIINEYGIARGSFYNYFDNIQDLYYFVLKEFKENIRLSIRKYVKDCDGDVFEAFTYILDYLFDLIEDEINEGIMKNIFLNSNGVTQNFIASRPDLDEINNEVDILYEIVDKSNLKIDNKNDLKILIEILTNNAFRNMMDYFMFKMPKDVVKENYARKIEIIKFGIVKI